MRVTAETREATRVRILETARRLFREQGFADATLRDIAREAELATGTFFNYFPSKEDVAVALAHEAAAKAHAGFLKKRRGDATLPEDLFLHIATQLRWLKPLRKFMPTVVDAGLASATLDGGTPSCRRLRREQLEAVAEILRDHSIAAERQSMTMPIYWALYVGVLSFWGRDQSPRQEDTLAMLDQSVNMFATWLIGGEAEFA
ncbi:MAG: TetR/AcrR family transcriptional regulator [Planctomycetes bacterium]|nr:TetR/AcrR family transcriptional regulator [Planctomycetota bacterium]